MICLCVFLRYVYVGTGAWRGQKGLDSLELELLAIVSFPW